MLSIWCPRLASDVALRGRPVEGAFALTLRAANADHLHCLNTEASSRGLHRGMALADARAICPGLSTRPADLAREASALATLRRWALRYAPIVAVDGSDGLVADISGVAHLFGGESELLADAIARLARNGILASGAIAATRGAAFALARHGGGIVPEGRVLDSIGKLPVTALRIDHEIAQGLMLLGLDTIAALAGQPRAPLARRFGQALTLRLDQALGHQSEPVGAKQEAPHYGVRMTLPEPIGLQSDVMAGLARLLERLCATLARHRMGARRVRLELRRVDHATTEVEIGLARPMRDPNRIAALFAKGVDEIDAGFGIDALRLTAPVVEPLAPEQLSGRQAAAIPGEDAMADLISSLGNRLGFERVQRLIPAESLIPERSFMVVAAAYSLPEETHPSIVPRPAILFPPEPAKSVSGRPPARFTWRRMRFVTLRAHGPERIAPEWWLDDPLWRSGPRDYWRIETQEGPRLWLFQTPLDAAWWVQGEFP